MRIEGGWPGGDMKDRQAVLARDSDGQAQWGGGGGLLSYLSATPPINKGSQPAAAGVE